MFYWCTMLRKLQLGHYNSVDDFNMHKTLDVSVIIDKFNVYVTLAIIPRTKEINKAF